MLDTLRTLAIAGVLGLGPVAASAATITPGGSYDLLADSYFFNGDFAIGDAGGSYIFTFTNTSSSSAAVTLLGGTVLQTGAEFAGGDDAVVFAFGDYDPIEVATGETVGFEDEFVVAAGETIDLVLTFGNVVDNGRRPGGLADIDFQVEAAVVPLPAAGLLLLGGLGGLAAVRRRRNKA